MKKIYLLVSILFFPFSGYSQDMKVDHYLSYAQSAFDSDTCCWRELSGYGHHHEAAILIHHYLEESNQVTNKHALYWHLGQMLAIAGETKAAIRYFKKTYNGFYTWFGGPDGKSWYRYARGTVAFLERDQKTLDRMLESWPAKWLPDKNYEALQSLQFHWDQTYYDAINP